MTERDAKKPIVGGWSGERWGEQGHTTDQAKCNSSTLRRYSSNEAMWVAFRNKRAFTLLGLY